MSIAIVPTTNVFGSITMSLKDVLQKWHLIAVDGEIHKKPQVFEMIEDRGRQEKHVWNGDEWVSATNFFDDGYAWNGDEWVSVKNFGDKI